MNRILFLFFVLGPLTVPFAGCVSQAQMNMQRALFAQEYRQLEDELYLAYQNMDQLEKSNMFLRSQLGQDDMESGERANIRPRRNQDAPNIAPISTEGLRPSGRVPGVLQNPSSSRPQVRQLPQMVEQVQYQQVEPEFASRPRKPAGRTTADLPLPIWRPNR